MAKKKPEVIESSHGLYAGFEGEGKGMPRVTEFTEQVPAVVGQEFGYILKIKKARGQLITFEIDHPEIPGEDGAVRPPFRGEQYVRSSDYDFYLGDGLWEPLEHMLGPWTLTTWLDGRQIARRTFLVVPPAIDWDAMGEQ